MTTQQPLAAMSRLVGIWTTEATHPAFPGLVVPGSVVVEWLEGRHFLIHRSTCDHPDFPDSISVIGAMDTDRAQGADDHPADTAAQPLSMHYFDSRGVFRVYDASVDHEAWRLWRDAPGMSQRFTGVFDEGSDTITGLWQLRTDDMNWHDDLQITYSRQH